MYVALGWQSAGKSILSAIAEEKIPIILFSLSFSLSVIRTIISFELLQEIILEMEILDELNTF